MSSHRSAYKLPQWVEWNDNDLNSEKWDSHISASKRQLLDFEDPDDIEWFPSNLGVAQWKRPFDLIHPKLLCVVENQNLDFDLISPNRHLITNELMRLIINQIVALVNLSARKNYLVPEAISNVFQPLDNNVWKPWQHVYSLCKAGKVPHQPVYNPWGKYVVRLFWMGCWRKIYVNDYYPMSIDGRCLLPLTQKAQELWPAILVKALLKVACLEYQLNDPRDFSAVEHLTGWIPEKITNYRHYNNRLWAILLSCCPKFEWPFHNDTEKDNINKRNSQIYQDGHIQIDHNPACVAMFADLHNYPNDNLAKLNQQINAILQSLNFTTKTKYGIYVTEIRTLPLQAPQSCEEIPSWKLIRRHLWDENYMNINKKIKCLGLFIPWLLSEMMDDNKIREVTSTVREVTSTVRDVTSTVREREFSTVKNPIMSLRMKRDLRRDISKYCETIQVQWIKFEDFSKCFRSLTVFHKPSCYLHWYKLVDMKLVQRKSSLKTLYAAMGQPVQTINDGVPIYLISESNDKTEIFISFSVCGIFSQLVQKKSAKYEFSRMSLFSSAKNFDSEIDSVGIEKGYLVVQSFDWQRQMPIEVILTLKTAATKGSLLVLPPGRQVIIITTRSSFGSIVNVCSNSSLVVGDEDAIFPKISSETIRFLAESETILALLLDCFTSFGNAKKFKENEEKLYSAICPKPNNEKLNDYYWAFSKAVFLLVAKVLDSSKLLPDAAFALRVFTLLPYTVALNESFLNAFLGKRSYFEESQMLMDYDESREPTAKEEVLKKYDNWYKVKKLVKLQSYIRRFLVRNVKRGRIKTHNKYQKRTNEQLTKFATMIQKQYRDNGAYLLRSYFHLVPDVMRQFSFHSDECNSILSHDYTGVTNFTPSTNSWVVVFRDVFNVLEDYVKITPCFHCHGVIWSQHIVNNDTLIETPLTILKTYQNIYEKNKHGYTITVRVCKFDHQKDVKWSLRLVSPLGSLYAPTIKDNSTHITSIKDIMDYYCPNKKNIIARYAIQAYKECVVTVQFVVSSAKVKLEVNVYQEDTAKILTIRGKTEVIVPAIYFRKFKKSDEKTYTYYVEVKVLRDSWLVDPAHISFIQALQLKEQMEIHLGLRLLEENEIASNMEDSVETESKGSIDQSRPFWLLKIIAENNLADLIVIKKDTRRVEKIRAIKQTWEDDEPGRFTNAYNARMAFLQKYGIDSILSSNTSSVEGSSEGSEKIRGWDVSVDDFSLLRQSTKILPELINTKVKLKTWNVANFVRRIRPEDKQTLKDKSLIQLQILVQKKLNENYNSWRNGVRAQAEQMKLKQISEKALLYDTHKQWMKRVNKRRTTLQELREEQRCKAIEQDEINDNNFAKAVEVIQSKLSDSSKKDPSKKK